MKNFSLTFIGSLFCTFPALTMADSSSIEARLDMLEKRLQSAERRASDAERQLQLLQEKTIPTSNVTPDNTPQFEVNQFGDLKLYGDVEFNLDGASRSGQLTSLKSTNNKYWRPGDKERWDIDGRILIGLDGYRRQDNGFFAGFSVQPLADMSGKMNLDDAAFFFGNEKNWQVKIGRFEAYDMFPLYQDTFVQYSGNTANDLYADGFGYIYMMKEGRGRSNSGGNLMLSKYANDWYFELNTLVENGTSEFVDDYYHGNRMEGKKNVVYVRPVIAWKPGNYRIAIAMESNVINNAYGYSNAQGKWFDQSRRNGYGLTVNWNNHPENTEDNLQVNFNTAYMDAPDENDFTTGLNFLWRRFALGYIYARNDIKVFNTASLELNVDDPFKQPGKYNIHTLHASYEIPHILNMDNFHLYLGAYFSHLNTDNNSLIANGNDKDRYGLRARFKYFF